MRFGDGGEEARLARLRAAGLGGTAPDPAWRALADHARLAFDAPVAGISLVGRDAVCWLALVGLPPVEETPRRNAFCDRTIAAAGACAVPDAANEPAFAAAPLAVAGVRSYLGAPVLLPGGAAVGAAAVMFRSPRRFLGPERALIESLAAVAGAMAARRSETPRDAATGALTEAGFRAALEEAAAAAMEHGHEAATLVIEPEGLDDLRLGVGDAAAEALLGALARRLTLRARETDVLGRIGRNLLALLLPRTTLSEGTAAARRLLSALAEGGEAGTPLSIGAAGLMPPAQERARLAALGAAAAEAAATAALQRAHAG
ncbi:MAG: diguanylate cyclase, partial [Paracoccaceae bacterium]